MVTEKERLKALKKYNILDTPPDGTFDNIVKITANILNVPIAIISLVDEDRIWFKAKVGLDAQQIDRDPGLCASAILDDELYVVEDASMDVRTLSNPLVASSLHLRFYAAAPLTTIDGFNLGTLCIIDSEPRALSIKHQDILRSLGDAVMDQMELRLQARLAIETHNEKLNSLNNYFKKFTKEMVDLTDSLRNILKQPQEVEKIADKIQESVLKNKKIIHNFVESSTKL